MLTDEGVDVVLDIDNAHDEIPADTLAVVGNRSAVGEQYVELQPQSDDGPTSHDGSVIAQATPRSRSPPTPPRPTSPTPSSRSTRTPLKTTVDELGAAFGGTGKDLQRIIDTGNSFIDTANDNFDVTTALIRDSNTVLHGQIDTSQRDPELRPQLQPFSSVLAGADPDLRHLIDTGGVAATQLRTFLEQNRVELGDLINNLVTTGDVVVKHLDGIKQILVIYPYVVEGGFTVVSKSPDTGLYDAHFGMIITTRRSATRATASTDTRPPQDGEQPADERQRPLRRAGHREQRPRRPERAARGRLVRRLAGGGVVRPGTGRLTWGDRARGPSSAGTLAPPS